MDPLDITIQKLSESRAVLERLITSSESFDYHGAKQALAELQGKIKELGRLKWELQQERRRSTPEGVISFPD